MSKRRLLRSLFPPLFALALCACAGTEKTPASDEAPVPAETGEPADPAAPFVAELEKALADGDADLAAHFAEYVLSANELKAFVEKNFPASATRTQTGNDAINSPAESAGEIRYTLARRLLREGRWAEARGFFPEELIPVFDAYVRAIQRGYDAELSDAERARAFWDAALIVRSDGDALFLAAAGPVYVSGGEWAENPILRLRLSENIASEEERLRAESRDVSRFVNDRRFRAAMLARNAASLLPNNNERTARLLCTAGVWLRYRDPKTADIFYKALVIRCPHTELGKRCDALRWFPPTLPWADEDAWDGTPAPAEKSKASTPSESTH